MQEQQKHSPGFVMIPRLGIHAVPERNFREVTSSGSDKTKVQKDERAEGVVDTFLLLNGQSNGANATPGKA